MVRLRIVPPPEIAEPAESPIFIGPDYAALRARNWARVHIAADRRDPFAFQAPQPPVGRR